MTEDSRSLVSKTDLEVLQRTWAIDIAEVQEKVGHILDIAREKIAPLASEFDHQMHGGSDVERRRLMDMLREIIRNDIGAKKPAEAHLAVGKPMLVVWVSFSTGGFEFTPILFQLARVAEIDTPYPGAMMIDAVPIAEIPYDAPQVRRVTWRTVGSLDSGFHRRALYPENEVIVPLKGLPLAR